MSDGKRMTRRGFVGRRSPGLWAAASSFLAGCSAPTSSSDSQEWDQEADVVVVGAGWGRTRGRHRSRERRCERAAVEGQRRRRRLRAERRHLGRLGHQTGEEQGIDADADDDVRWFTRHPEWYGPRIPPSRACWPTRAERRSIGCRRWAPFLKEVGPLFGYTELPVIHHVDGKGAEMVRVLAETAEKAGVGTLNETPRQRSWSPTRHRRRRRRHRRGGGSEEEPRAHQGEQGVVMATGSFAGSTAMIGQMNAECANLLPSEPGATGDGLVMAMELGAYTTRVSDMPLMSSLAGL